MRLVALPCVRLVAMYSLVCGLPHCFVCGLIIVWNVSTTKNKCLGSVVEGGERKEGCGEMWDRAGGGGACWPGLHAIRFDKHVVLFLYVAKKDEMDGE